MYIQEMYKEKNMDKMIAYCGLDCRKCDAYIATINDNQALRKKTAELWSQMNNAPITADMINCEGCRVDGKKTPFCESLCDIRQCAMKKGVETCGACEKMGECKKVEQVIGNNHEAKENLRK